MNNKSIQFLRGTREALKNNLDKETLQPGQPLYNITDNELIIGGANGNSLKKSPISVRELKGNKDGINSTNTTNYDYSIKYENNSFNINSISNIILKSGNDNSSPSLTISSTAVTVDKAPTKANELVRYQEYDALSSEISSVNTNLGDRIKALEDHPFDQYANKEKQNTFIGEGNIFTKQLELQEGLNFAGFIDVSKNYSKGLNLRSTTDKGLIYNASIKLPNAGGFNNLNIQLPNYYYKSALYGDYFSGIATLRPTFFNNLFYINLRYNKDITHPNFAQQLDPQGSPYYVTIGSLSLISYSESVDINSIVLTGNPAPLIDNMGKILYDNDFKVIVSSGYLISCDSRGNVNETGRAFPITDFYVDKEIPALSETEKKFRINIGFIDINGNSNVLQIFQNTFPSTINNLVVSCSAMGIGGIPSI